MKKITRSCFAILLFITTVGLPTSFSQQLIFCDSIAGNKLVGQSNEFNIDSVSKVITILLYNGDVPFTTTKLVMKFFELTNDTTETYLSRLVINVPPNSRNYMGRLPFLSPNKYKIKFYTYENKLLADEKLTITARKQPTGNAGFAAVLNEVIGFYPANFKNILGTKGPGNGILQAWNCNENLPGYDYSVIMAWGMDKYYDYFTFTATLMETIDSTEALSKYNEISKLISGTKFDCCDFNNEEEVSYDNDKYLANKTTTWYPSSVHSGKDNKYAEMPLKLMISYSGLPKKEYTVNLKIGFNDVNEKLLYALKHSKFGN